MGCLTKKRGSFFVTRALAVPYFYSEYPRHSGSKWDKINKELVASKILAKGDSNKQLSLGQP